MGFESMIAIFAMSAVTCLQLKYTSCCLPHFPFLFMGSKLVVLNLSSNCLTDVLEQLHLLEDQLM